MATIGGVVKGSGTGTVALHDVMLGETTTTGHPGETETFLMIGEGEADDAATGATAMVDSEAELNRNARKAQAPRQRRRSLHQT